MTSKEEEKHDPTIWDSMKAGATAATDKVATMTGYKQEPPTLAEQAQAKLHSAQDATSEAADDLAYKTGFKKTYADQAKDGNIDAKEATKASVSSAYDSATHSLSDLAIKTGLKKKELTLAEQADAKVEEMKKGAQESYDEAAIKAGLKEKEPTMTEKA